MSTKRLKKEAYERPEYDAWYKTRRWKNKRLSQLRRFPMCAWCAQKGELRPANTAHHKEPHKGDANKFWHGELESLCKHCHDSEAQHFERDERALYWPRCEPSALPLTLVCGPPAAGKTLYVVAHSEPDDIVIDLDEIIREISGIEHKTADARWRTIGLMTRNERLRSLAGLKNDGRRAWFVTTAPKAQNRIWWYTQLWPKQVLLLMPPRLVTVARAKHDPIRQDCMEAQLRAINRWYASYSPWASDVVDRK